MAVSAEQDNGAAGVSRAVRPLDLRRRRSRVPWIYLLYHRPPNSCR